MDYFIPPAPSPITGSPLQSPSVFIAMCLISLRSAVDSINSGLSGYNILWARLAVFTRSATYLHWIVELGRCFHFFHCFYSLPRRPSAQFTLLLRRPYAVLLHQYQFLISLPLPPSPDLHSLPTVRLPNYKVGNAVVCIPFTQTSSTHLTLSD